MIKIWNFKQWKNIPDIIMSMDTSIRQQLLNTKIYRSQKLHEQVEELSCWLCWEKQETVSHILCGCSHVAQSLVTKLDMTKCFFLSIMLFLKNMDSLNLIVLLHGMYSTYNLILSHAKKTTKQRYNGTYHGNLKNALRSVKTSQIPVC